MSDSSSNIDSEPFEEQRRIFDLLSQETRHLIIQYILGHPEHLMSLDELDYMIPKSKAAISDQIDNLVEAGILDVYHFEPSKDKRDLPSKFYGLTEYGVEVLYEYNYLRGVPFARALYKNTRKSDKVERHENAPRPQLPKKVRETFELENEKDAEQLEQYIGERKGQTLSTDDQFQIVKMFLEEDIHPDDEGLTRREIDKKVDLEFTPQTSLDHLREIDLIEEVPPSGPEILLISERIDEIVNSRLDKELDQNLEGLIEHIDSELRITDTENVQRSNVATAADGAGRSIRSLLAREFDISPESVESYLREGDKLTKLNTAVKAIEESKWATKGDEYGKMNFVRPPSHYRLTQKAIKLAEN